MSGKLKATEGLIAVQNAVHDTVQAGAASTMRSFEQTMAGLKTGAEAATNGQAHGQLQGDLRQGLDQMQGQVRQGMEKAVKSAEQIASFSQGNAEAMVKSGQILAAGMQDLSRQIMESAQNQLDQSMATMRALSGVKSPKDMLELQSSFLRSAYEAMLAESGRITERSMKLAEQAS
ncbi:MAG: phasin family protein, partial [Janthinobacterium lividum]